MLKTDVLIDGYFLGQPSGYGRFIFELCRCIGSADTDLKFTVLARRGTDKSFTPGYRNMQYVYASGRPFPFWEQFMVPAWAYWTRSKLVHFPYNTRALYIGGRKSITTVHDLTFFVSDAQRDFKASLIHSYMRMAFARGTRRSTRIVAVSDTTQRALGRVGLAASRVYNTVDGFLATPRARRKSDRPYFLHRGSYAAGHRNTDRTIRAFLGVPLLKKHYTLKILGAPDGARTWNTVGERSIEYLPRLSDSELASLYVGSSCVVAASLLEGFCLPIVEGFGFGAPVITSDIDPMKEIAGDAALLVAPAEQDEIGAAMLRVATDPALAATLVAKGNSRMAVFSAESVTRDLLTIYRAALGVL